MNILKKLWPNRCQISASMLSCSQLANCSLLDNVITRKITIQMWVGQEFYLHFAWKRLPVRSNINCSTVCFHSFLQENIYEEFQEHLEYPDSETATNTVYLTVNPPNQPDSLHYSTINFQSRSNRAGGETPTVKPSSSAYKYSAVTFSKRPTNSSVNQLHRPTEESLYSRVKRTGKN